MRPSKSSKHKIILVVEVGTLSQEKFQFQKPLVSKDWTDLYLPRVTSHWVATLPIGHKGG